jgi:hypothetical protein
MNTNKLGLLTVEEFNAGYQPVYQNIMSSFLGGSQAYSEQVGKMDFRKVEAIGDIRGKQVTPKDTEIKQISATDVKKSFKKYFLANQFRISQLQDQQGTNDVVAQVLDEHWKHMDELFLFGEGSSASTMLNNGLYWSDDSNYVLESSVEIDTDADPLIDLHSKVLTNAQKADRVAGRKLIMFYGDEVLPLFDGVYASQPVPFKRVLGEVLGSNYSMMKMPVDITPSQANGWMIVNLDQIKVHYTAIPSLKKQGSNEELGYNYFNFLYGSCMTEVKALNGIIRQPATLEA